MVEKTLGDVATYINGRAFKPQEWETSGRPIIRIQNLTNSTQECNRTTKQFEEKYRISDGDLLFAWSASLGAHIWHGEDGWLNQHIFKVIPNESIDKIYFANCKCKLDTCTVELSESERRSGWKPLASVLGDAAAAFGCVNRVEELVKQLLRGAVAKLLARPSVQFISCSQDILSRESLNGHALRNEGSKQPVVTFVLGTFPRGVGMRKVDCTAPVLDLTERRELRAVVHGNGLEDL